MTASENLKSPAAVSKIAEFVSHLRQLKYKKKKYLLVVTTLKNSRRNKILIFILRSFCFSLPPAERVIPP